MSDQHNLRASLSPVSKHCNGEGWVQLSKDCLPGRYTICPVRR